MKILHICTYDSGGAGKAALRLHLGLKLLGVSSKMLVRERTCSDSDVVELRQNDNVFVRQCNKLRKRLYNSELARYKSTRLKGWDLFDDDRTAYNVGRHPLVQEADIINLHWVNWMLSPREFFMSIKRKPVVWTLHDMNTFTGGCHTAWECLKFEDGCGECPQLGSSTPGDLSRRIFLRKQRSYRGANIYIVTPSRWLAGLVQRSALFKNQKIFVIPNSIPLSVFRKRDKKYSRELLNLPQDKIIILCSISYNLEHKGLKYLLQAMKIVVKNIGPSKISLVLFGEYDSSLFRDEEFDVYFLGYIKDELVLSCCYSAGDILVIPSVAENYPNSILESIACGTPVVSFNVGGISEIIRPHETGLLAGIKNAQDLASKIEWMVIHDKERQDMQKLSRETIEQSHTLETQANRYLELYESVYCKEHS
jgi:glycosyltransferase involved in cell wall biosynthesis